VGATELIGNGVGSGERAVSDPSTDFYSGGGFSNYFSLPSYQASAVKNFMKRYAPNYGPNVYNDSGDARGFPGISAIGQNVPIVFNGETIPVGGTRVNCPLVAGLVTLLNEARLKQGKGPVGFLNPTFYKNLGAFNDITIGNNPGCGTGGFNAFPGWDPVTGLGTPNFAKLKEVFLSLP
jgi:tripeptidyl-peptidase I